MCDPVWFELIDAQAEFQTVCWLVAALLIQSKSFIRLSFLLNFSSLLGRVIWIVLWFLKTVKLYSCTLVQAAKAKPPSSPRPPPSPTRPPNTPPNISGYEIPHRRNRNENYTEQRSIVISDYHTISNSYIEVYDPTENRNENSDQTYDGNKDNTSQAEVNTSGCFPTGRSHSVTLQNNEGNTTSGGENNNPLIPQLKRQSYEKPVQQSREKPIQLRSIWP